MKITPALANPQRAGDLVQVRIEELVLHGFAAGDRRRIAAAVEGELARLIGKGGQSAIAQNSPALERMDGGTFKVQGNARPQTSGTQIAQAVYRSLQRSSLRAQKRTTASATAMNAKMENGTNE